MKENSCPKCKKSSNVLKILVSKPLYEVSDHNGNPFREIFIIMKQYALSASSSNVARSWWCPLGMTVRLDGSRSIRGTWWLHIITTGIQPTSSVLTGTQSMFLVAMPTRMVLCCTLWKVFVARYHVFLMSAVESWHVLCAPSDEKIPLTVAWPPCRWDTKIK